MTTNSDTSMFPAGALAIGCNYWASHAGLFMWRDWRPDVVEADLAKLAAGGVQWLRVFPLWPDFQPIHQLRGQNGVPVEIRFGEEPLPSDPIGQAGLSAEMLERFAILCGIAERAGLKLVVGLLTGWMSGRLFVPPALEGLNPISDATSIAWQVRFVRRFVSEMKRHPAIAAWDLGNECNCMGQAPGPDAAFTWTATIANAIRSADPVRQVVSGMHSLSAATTNTGNPWLIEHQGELTDILTTHPYPYWVRHTNLDAVTAFRTTFHATAESRFYADIGGKPCIAEEIGTMGPMVGGDQVSADFARVNMFSLWANDCRAMAWWCAHDQTELARAPYDWNGVELELGLLRTDGTAKPVLEEMRAFRTFVDALPFSSLPKPRTEAVCILTHNQDDWAVAYGAFVLGKQAKLEMAFRHIQQPIPDAPIYLLPSLKGANCIPRRKWLDLLERVRAGATLYLSLGDGIVPGFNEATGVVLQTRAKPASALSMTLGDGTVLDLPGADDLLFEVTSAEVIGRRTGDGRPAYWRNAYGAGTIVVVAAPIEDMLTRIPGAFTAPAMPYWSVYRGLAEGQKSDRLFHVSDPDIAATEHVQPDGTTVVCLINHSAQSKVLPLHMTDKTDLLAIFGGGTVLEDEAPAISVAAFNCCLLHLQARN